MQWPAKLWNVEHRALHARLAAALADRGDAENISGYDVEIRDIVEEKAELTRKNPYYLARSFDDETKAECARFHYGWLLDRVAASSVHALLTGAVHIWTADCEGVRYTVALNAERYVAREGELTLELWAGKTSLYMLSFSAVPARLFGLDTGAALLVSRIQGRPERFEDIRLATKALSEVSPRALLFAALAGIAAAEGLFHIAGVTGENFVNYLDDKREALERQYDAFYESLDAVGPANGFYLVDLRVEPKPVNAQKAGHRIRTRRKRQLKQQIADTVAQAWAARLLATEFGPPAAAGLVEA